MNPAQQPDSYEAADYFSWLRRRWWIVLVLTVVGGVAAFGYATVAPKSYTAMAAVSVVPVAGLSNNVVANGRTGSLQVNLDTEAQIVTSLNVAGQAGKIMHSNLPPFQLASHVAVTVPPNSSILDIACSWTTGAGSAQCAQAFATAYLNNRSATAAQQINSTVKSLEQTEAADTTKLGQLSSAIARLPRTSAQRVTDTNQVHLLGRQIQTLSNQVATASAGLGNLSGGSIITPASAPSKPTSPKKLIILPSGVVGGLVLGLIIGFFMDRRDKRIHGPSDIARLIDAPVLLDLPAGTFGREISLASPRSKLGHEFTELAHSISASLGEGNHVLLVAGTSGGAGRSVIAANLAATLARTHTEVVLVCAALNGTVAPDLLGVGEPGAGLAELVTGSATVRDVVRAPAGMPGLWVITPGADPSLAVYLRHDTARELISRLRRDVRYVVIEVQATEEGADTFALAEFADASVLTVETERTTRDGVADCIRRLRQLRTPILGTVMFGAIAGRVSVRPPRERHSRMGGSGALESRMGQDGPPNGPGRGGGYNELSALSGMQDRRGGPPMGARDMYGDHADSRVTGG
ncbi:MAG TPA: Wzz/FepE/Etk N-terminal domain-containing protein [Streptosporangiaceae bacterium]|nr:Wzz/FepE/Etk N-terminal domain-containing protein [Streptosporangiaceae bacterium]